MQRFCCVFRRLLALVSDKVERRRRFLEIDEHYKHAKILLCICESSTKKEKKERERKKERKKEKKNKQN